MQWSDVATPPSPRVLRQFGALCLVVFVGLGAWRYWRGGDGRVAAALVVAGLVVGVLGLVRPPTIRWVFTAWMVAAFPIGWTVSKLILGLLFYGMFTPLALVFRLVGRDVLSRRRKDVRSYWIKRSGPGPAGDYFKQF